MDGGQDGAKIVGTSSVIAAACQRQPVTAAAQVDADGADAQRQQSASETSQMARVVATAQTVDQNRNAIAGLPAIRDGIVQDELVAARDRDAMSPRRMAHGRAAEEVTKDRLDVPIPQQPRRTESVLGRRWRTTINRQVLSPIDLIVENL